MTGGKLNSLATSVFRIAPASSNVKPLTRSVINDEEAIADPHPKVLNFTSLIRPDSSTRICSFITSPQAGAPTLESVEILQANSEGVIERRRDHRVERKLPRDGKGIGMRDVGSTVLCRHRYHFSGVIQRCEVDYNDQGPSHDKSV